MSTKVYEPISPPDTPLATLDVPTLSQDQIDKYNEVEKHFSDASYKLPDVADSDAALTENEKFWLSHECILRFLRATKWVDARSAIERLENTLKWRRDFGLDTIVTTKHVEPEAVTGKEILYGFDYWGRPAFYMIPSRQNTTDTKRQNQFAVWMLERCVDLMAPGVETIDLLINFAEKAKNPSLGQARDILNILQSHYPERLGMALILNVPWILNAFFKLITPFIDPHTRTKMKFNPTTVGEGPGKSDKETFFLPDQVMKDAWGGSQDFEYEHEKYWPKLVSLCESRREAWLANWRALGGKVGIKEIDYKTKAAPAPTE